MRNATVVFLIKRDPTSKITDVLLAMKKRGFGVNKWNGVGGKVNEGLETILEAAAREANEEIAVVTGDLVKVGEFEFHFVNNPDWGQNVHVFLTETWEGDPIETEEMAPQWFKIEDVPYESMWADDKHWMPSMFEGSFVKGRFSFGDNNDILNMEVNIVDQF